MPDRNPEQRAHARIVAHVWVVQDASGMKKSISKRTTSAPVPVRDYSNLLGGVSELLESARRASSRAVNAFMTATYWEPWTIPSILSGGSDRSDSSDTVAQIFWQSKTSDTVARISAIVPTGSSTPSRMTFS
jgi:hypothetical protein